MPPTPSPRAGQDVWARIQERLARAARATEESGRLSPERARAILEERARRLARAGPRAAPAGESLLVVTFALGGERYGLEAVFVREVKPAGILTPLPGVPDYCAGLLNLRGQLLPVFALGALLGLPAAAAGPAGHILFVGEDRAELGFLAENVFEVTTVAAGELLEPASAAPAGARPYLRGVSPAGLTVLAARELLQDPRLVLDQKEEFA